MFETRENTIWTKNEI